MSALDTIIKRLERASGPDREIDVAITRFISGASEKEHWFRAFDGRLITDGIAPHLTASIDSALTLVPMDEDTCWSIAMPTSRKPWARIWLRETGDNLGEAYHKSFAIALCIAALRARSHSTLSDNEGGK